MSRRGVPIWPKGGGARGWGQGAPGFWLGSVGKLWGTGMAQADADIRRFIAMGRSGPAVGFPAVFGRRNARG